MKYTVDHKKTFEISVYSLKSKKTLLPVGYFALIIHRHRQVKYVI